MNRRGLALAIVAIAALAPSGEAREEFSVWVQADPEQPDVQELRDSARDMVRKFDSKVLSLATSKQKAWAVFTITERFERADEFAGGIAEWTIVKIRVDISGMTPREFQGRATTWTGAANNARKNAEKWIKGRFGL